MVISKFNYGGTVITQFSIKNKTDQNLIHDTKTLVAQERQVLSDFLHHLREIEIRKLFLKRGYPSLFAFMTQELGYSESAAGRRIQTMRLIKDIPEVEEKIKSGKISLSVASQMQGFFRQENIKRHAKRQNPISPKEKLELVSRLAGTSSRKCEVKLAEIAPERVLPQEKIRPLTAEKTQIQFLADVDLMSKIQRLKELTSHQNPEGKLEPLFNKALELALEQLDPERQQQRRLARKQKQIHLAPKKAPGKKISKSGKRKSSKPSNLLPTSGANKPRRHIPQALRDRIWVRDAGQCQHVDPLTGRKCASKHRVQVDHQYPFSLVPEHSEANLRLLCAAHNQFRWESLHEVLPGKTGCWQEKGDSDLKHRTNL